METFVYDFIGEVSKESVDMLIDYIKSKVDTIGSLTINMNSKGGDVQSAVYAYNYLKSCNFPIYTHNLAAVSSSAVLIYLAGVERTCGAGAYFMIHKLSINLEMMSADYFTFMEYHNGFLQTIDSYANIILSTTIGFTYDSIKKILQSENLYIDKDKAIELGIINKI